MPPRKSKINKIVNEQAEQKIQSFVNKANDNECDTSSEDDTNIYIKSIKNNITESVGEQAPPPPQAGLIKKSKAKPTRASRVIQPSPEPSPFMDERYLKLFSDYKNELAELKTIITGTNQQQTQPPVFQSQTQGVVDTRREAMKLKFS